MSIYESDSYIFQVKGENTEPKPAKSLEITEVYLIIDQKFRIIWIWSGKKSKLFHRYIAASWAGKLKFKKQFHDFKYRMIKAGQEPEVFLQKFGKFINSSDIQSERDYNVNVEEEHQDNYNLSNAQTRIQENEIEKSKNYQEFKRYSKPGYLISISDHDTIKTAISEIKEIHKHVIYTLQRVEQRISEVESIIKHAKISGES